VSVIEGMYDYQRHDTASGYVTTPDQLRLLLVAHRKLRRWLPPGGHVEDGELAHDAVLREVLEETGVEAIHPAVQWDLQLGGVIDVQLPAPIAVSAQFIGHGDSRIGKPHIHIDHIFRLSVREGAGLTTTVDLAEVEACGWFTRAEILEQMDVFDATRAFAKRFMDEEAG
jgi:ADP-ribose pyrophosphatase YjhB (NUDIX family)